MNKHKSNPFTESNMAAAMTNLAIDVDKSFKASTNRGYVIAPQKILRCFGLNETEKTVLLDIASMTGERGYAFYSHNYLAFKLGKKSTSTVKGALKSLKKKGFINWKVGGGDLGTNHYFLRNLHFNPYLVISEAVHYFVEEVVDAFRNQITYQNIYGPILKFVCTEHYNVFIDHLTLHPEERDCDELYLNLFARLFRAMSYYGSVYLDKSWQDVFKGKFLSSFFETIKSTPRFTLHLTDFSIENYKRFRFPIEIEFTRGEYRDGSLVKSANRIEAEVEIVNQTEKYIKSLTRKEIILLSQERGIPITYEETEALHIANGGAKNDMFAHVDCSYLLEEELRQEALERWLHSNNEERI